MVKINHEKNSKKSYVMIIGAMKAGTTSLYKYLCNHPRICRCKTKEPDFFVDKKASEVDADSYERLWNCGKDKSKIYLEASTSYTKYPFNQGVPEKMHKCNICPKFIYVVRDPVERIESQYNFIKISKSKTVNGFRDERLVRISKYYEQISRFLDVFPNKEEYLIVGFENLVENPGYVLDRCKRFLELSRKFNLEDRGAHNKTPKYKTDLWISKLGWIKNKIGNMVSEDDRKSIKNIIRKLSPKIKHKKIGVSERKKIKNEIEEDIEKFGNEFSFDVSKWGF